MTINGLILNASKTKFVSFGSKRLTSNIRIHSESCRRTVGCGCVIVERVATHKFLGLHIDTDLKFKTHTLTVGKKLLSGAVILTRLRSIVLPKLKRTFYFSLFESNVRFTLPISGGTNDVYLNRIVKLQKRAVKCVSGADYTAHTAPLYAEQCILPFTNLYALTLILLIYPYLPVFDKAEHDYHTRYRSTGCLSVTTMSKTYCRKTPIPNFCNLYNNLPLDIVTYLENQNVCQRSSSKRRLKYHVMSLDVGTLRDLLHYNDIR